MGKIRTIIVDDELYARGTIRLLLENDPDIIIIGECANGIEAVRFIRKQEPDLLFLDIQMPEMNGFEVLERVGTEQSSVIVFVTAYDEYALRAFEVNALDYLLKPFSDERFAKTLKRAKDQIQNKKVEDTSKQLLALLEYYNNNCDPKGFHKPPELAQSVEQKYLDRIVIKSAGRIFFLKVDEINWIEAADQYVQLHTADKTHLLRETMNNLEANLDPEKFLRIHRSTIVNLECIKEFQPYYNGEYVVLLCDGTRLKLSRNYRKKLQDILNSSL